MDMEKNTQTVFISLAGVGGCSVSRALRSLGQNALPFDWLIARQDFVISAIESGGTAFFDFDDHARLHGETIITVPDRSALSIHDFRQNWAAEKENVRKKYRRRWNRFHDILYSRPGARQPTDRGGRGAIDAGAVAELAARAGAPAHRRPGAQPAAAGVAERDPGPGGGRGGDLVGHGRAGAP